MYIYAMQFENFMGHIKIGRTSNITARKAALKKVFGEIINCHALEVTDRYGELEKYIHTKLDYKREKVSDSSGGTEFFRLDEGRDFEDVKKYLDRVVSSWNNYYGQCCESNKPVTIHNNFELSKWLMYSRIPKILPEDKYILLALTFMSSKDYSWKIFYSRKEISEITQMSLGAVTKSLQKLKRLKYVEELPIDEDWPDPTFRINVRELNPNAECKYRDLDDWMSFYTAPSYNHMHLIEDC